MLSYMHSTFETLFRPQVIKLQTADPEAESEQE